MRINANAIPPNILRLMPESERRLLGQAGLTVTEVEAINGRKLEKRIQEEIAQYLGLHGVTFFR
jgi:hypothetical protein